MAYAPPDHPPLQYESRPVNFRDHDESDEYPPHSTQSPDVATTFTGYTSGITVPYSGTYVNACTPYQAHLVLEYVNERGETRAQEVASEYVRRNTDEIPPVPPIPLYPASAALGDHQRDLQPGDRTSTATHSVDALTYIDEHFNYYPSKRQPDSPTDHPTAPLVANAAGRQDLGTVPPFLISLSALIPL